MNLKPTSDLCASYGHNYVRAIDDKGRNDVVRCKQCDLQFHLSSDGDFDKPQENRDIYELMRQLFLIRRRHKRVTRGLAIN